MKKLLLAALVAISCGGPVSPPPPTTLPSPQPSPTSSPVCLPIAQCVARTWKVGIRECADVAFGEGCLMDTTPFFEANGNVGRCNTEDTSGCVSSCGTPRACEPDFTRGPEFRVTVLSGSLGGWVRADNPYQIKLQGVRGKVKVQACWWGDDIDQEDGTPIDLSSASCGQVVVEPKAGE